jgi:hypothetical protein
LYPPILAASNGSNEKNIFEEPEYINDKLLSILGKENFYKIS